MLRLTVGSRSLGASLVALLACGVAALHLEAVAAPKTVCTVTINSADERDVFQRHLPRGDYRFVELVQRGQPDWLAEACRRGVKCDALIISGHFDDGSEFYTDRVDDREFLTLHEMQRASCSASCSGLFAQLKEVYLFGCNTLKAEPRFVASAEIARHLVAAGQTPAGADRASALLSERYGQSNRDRLRHVFKDVPLLYGFSSKAPLGRNAGPLLERFFKSSHAVEVGSGRANPTLLSLFAPSSMLAVSGLTDADPHAGFRQDMCALADDRPSDALKLAFMRQVLRRDMAEVRMFLEHLEHYAASLVPTRRLQPEVASALAMISGDHGTRGRYLDFARDADDASVHRRMMALARSLGWLSAEQEQAEFLQMVARRMARGSLGRTEVDMVCATQAGRDPALAQQVLDSGAAQIGLAAHAAALACLGSEAAHERTVRALTGSDDEAVALAQIYLRHRPLVDVAELRRVASGIAGMKATSAQVRALETLARQRLTDPQSVQQIAHLFAHVRSLEVQRAIAGLLVRSDYRVLAQAEFARQLRQHRLKSPDGNDVIDLLIRLLQTS